MSEKIVQLNEAVIKSELKELVRGSVEEILNELLETETEKLTQAARYERNEQRSMKLKEAAKKVEDCIEETLTDCDFPSEHWTRIRTTMSLNGSTGRSAAVLAWWGVFRTATPPSAGLCPAAPCGWHPVGQQEIYEHDTPGGCP